MKTFPYTARHAVARYRRGRDRWYPADDVPQTVRECLAAAARELLRSALLAIGGSIAGLLAALVVASILIPVIGPFATAVPALCAYFAGLWFVARKL